MLQVRVGELAAGRQNKRSMANIVGKKAKFSVTAVRLPFRDGGSDGGMGGEGGGGLGAGGEGYGSNGGLDGGGGTKGGGGHGA